eukprot:4367619-Prymnesium_polylepis.2
MDVALQILFKNAVRVIDLFREWDEDGNGEVSKKEFRQAMASLGTEANKKDIDGRSGRIKPARKSSACFAGCLA